MIYGTAYGGGSSNWGIVFKVRTDGSGFTTLHGFTGADGAYPCADLLLSGNMLFGTTEHGGSANQGTVFTLDTNGTGFATLHCFTNGADGANPRGGLVLSGNTLFGTAYFGGSERFGTIFKLDTHGDNFTTLHSFTYYGTDGAYPAAALVLSGNTLYGTAHSGGRWGYGTVFKLNTDGSGFSPILACQWSDVGAGPWGALVISGNTLYGTTSGGGGGYGNVFKINTDGTGYTTLHAFPGGGTDGNTPQAGLVLVGDLLYGTTLWSGDSSHGTVFQVNTQGTHFATLHSFETGSYNSQVIITNSDGANPYAGLALCGNRLYGTTSAGGINGWGTIFELPSGFSSVPLHAQSISNVVVLSWTSSLFSLQAAPAPTGVYTNILGATNPYTNTMTAPQMFFRLQAN
jgi:uncharacterized repeat protein (TIGR03803 family)